jgi:hypothetical protein
MIWTVKYLEPFLGSSLHTLDMLDGVVRNKVLSGLLPSEALITYKGALVTSVLTRHAQ